MKRYLVFFVVLFLVCVEVTNAQTYQDLSKAVESAPFPQPEYSNGFVTKENIIDGAKNPERISSETAYAMLFRLIASFQDEESKQIQIKSYVQELLKKKSETCENRSANANDVKVLIKTSIDFNEKIKIVEDKFKTKTDGHTIHHHLNVQSIKEQIKVLQNDRVLAAKAMISTLKGRLTAKGYENLEANVNNYIKSKIKIAPGPPLFNKNS